MRRKLWSLFILMLTVFLMVLPAGAAENTASGTFGENTDNLSWSLDSNGTLTISGTGNMDDFYLWYDVPWMDYNHIIQKVVIKKGVTNISDYAFNNCFAMKEISIASTVTSIGSASFTDCTGLTEITIPKGVKEIKDNAFSQCYNLASVTIGNGVTTIGEYAFFNCTSLKEVTLGTGLKKIGWYAFYPCFDQGDVYFRGTKSAWNAIDIEDGNHFLTSSRIHFKAGTQTHSYTTKTVKPTCTNTGYTIHTCSCGISYRGELKDATGHSYAASSFSGGRTTYRCSTCGSSYTEKSSCYAPVITHNKNRHNYDIRATVMTSFLAEHPDGNFTRVSLSDSRVHIEQYDSKFQFMSHRELPLELPLFGGYYFDGTCHFLVFGQENQDERDDVEVFRVVKYNDSWERLGAASAYGFDTTIPFRSGSLRMTSKDGILYVRTSHQMYTRADGLRHQANITLHVNISDMTLADTDTNGYVSHSFNQFIINDGSYIVKADHGDAYPRSVVLYRDETQVDVLNIKGSIGDNSTGVSVGGLADSNKNYLVVGNSIDQNSSASFSGQRNIFVTVTSKSNFSEDGTKIIWLTSHSSGVSVSTPQLVKISGTEFCVLWTENGKLCYTFLNGQGKKTTEIFRKSSGAMSDCQPVFANGTISWFVSDGTYLKFYSIDPDSHQLSVAAAYSTKSGPTVKAANISSTGKIKLTWNKVSSAQQYRIFYATKKNGAYKLLKTTKSASFTHTGASAGETYYYYVIAVSSDGVMTRPGNTVSRICKCAQPEITLSNVASSGKLRLKWNSVEGAVKYQIYRAVGKSGEYKLLKTTTKTSFVNSSTTAGTTYYYKIKACGETSASNSVFSKAKHRVCDLARPDVTAANVASSGRIKLTWNAIDGASKYEIWRSTGKNDTYQKIKTTTALSYTDKNAEAGETWYYKVKAVHSNAEANSAWSQVRSCTHILLPPVVSAFLDDDGKPVLTWDAVQGAAEYQVYRADGDDSAFTLLKALTESAFTDEDAAPGKTYCYKVIAVCDSAAGSSAYSNTVSVTTKDAPAEEPAEELPAREEEPAPVLEQPEKNEAETKENTVASQKEKHTEPTTEAEDPSEPDGEGSSASDDGGEDDSAA